MDQGATPFANGEVKSHPCTTSRTRPKETFREKIKMDLKNMETWSSQNLKSIRVTESERFWGEIPNKKF